MTEPKERWIEDAEPEPGEKTVWTQHPQKKSSFNRGGIRVELL